MAVDICGLNCQADTVHLHAWLWPVGLLEKEIGVPINACLLLTAFLFVVTYDLFNCFISQVFIYEFK